MPSILWDETLAAGLLLYSLPETGMHQHVKQGLTYVHAFLQHKPPFLMQPACETTQAGVAFFERIVLTDRHELLLGVQQAVHVLALLPGTEAGTEIAVLYACPFHMASHCRNLHWPANVR